MSTQPIKEVRARKPRARKTEVIIGALQERILSLPNNEESYQHRERALELIDELSRSLNRGTEEE